MILMIVVYKCDNCGESHTETCETSLYTDETIILPIGWIDTGEGLMCDRCGLHGDKVDKQ